MNGSSPRPWGTLRAAPRSGCICRFIPTPVGNTRADVRREQADAVHPHARGEHQASEWPAMRNNGSSPRPWGTPHDNHHCFYRPRFIPTPVGNTEYMGSEAKATAVHPHARGEHSSKPFLPW